MQLQSGRINVQAFKVEQAIYFDAFEKYIREYRTYKKLDEADSFLNSLKPKEQI